MADEAVIRFEQDPGLAEGMRRWRKKPVVVRAERQRVPFEVVTLEGVMRGRPGDWLVVGVRGEPYPCAHDVFVATYEPEARR